MSVACCQLRDDASDFEAENDIVLGCVASAARMPASQAWGVASTGTNTDRAYPSVVLRTADVSTATTGRSAAMASISTRQTVSVTDGNSNTAAAYAAARAPSGSRPAKVVEVPANARSSSWRSGPSPTNVRRTGDGAVPA